MAIEDIDAHNAIWIGPIAIYHLVKGTSRRPWCLKNTTSSRSLPSFALQRRNNALTALYKGYSAFPRVSLPKQARKKIQGILQSISSPFIVQYLIQGAY